MMSAGGQRSAAGHEARSLRACFGTVGGDGTIALVLSLLALVLIRYDFLPFLRGPAPYPPEWRWELRTEPPSGRVLPALACTAGLLALLAVSGLPGARQNPRLAARAILAGAVALGLGFQLALLDLEPGGAMESLFQRAVSRTGTSYYTVAVSPAAEDPVSFLDHHAELLEGFRKAAKHAATHPPGPVLYYRGFIAAAERSPRLTRWVLRAAGLPEENPRRPRPQHSTGGRAGALSGALVIALLCAATAWPIAAFARHVGCDRLPAARLGVLWTLVPGAALMTPQFDQALALPVTGATVAIAAAAQSSTRLHTMAWALAAGLLSAAGLFFSYGAAIFVLIGGLAALSLQVSRPDSLRRAATVTLVAVAACFLVVMMPALLGHEPLQAARTALKVHREFYTSPRSYVLWLFFNPLDLALFLGVPVAVLAVIRTLRSLLRIAGLPAGATQREDLLRAAAALGAILLVLSGLTRGEVGRIWIPLMPLLLVSALAPTIPNPSPEWAATRTRSSGPTMGETLLVGAFLAALCLAMRLSWQVP